VNWRPTIVHLLLACSASLTSLGCGDDAANDHERLTDQVDVETAAKQLAGRYAHYDVVAYDSGTIKTLIISYGLTDLSVEDGKLIEHDSFCHAEQRSDQPVETTISDAATQAIKPKSIAVEISRKDGRYHLWRPETPTGVGIHLEDPATQALPEDPHDPRIADDDRDGNPGITVHIKISDSLQGDLFIARREIFAYSLDEQDDGSLIGTVSDRSEQLVIGASDPIFAIASTWTQHADLTKSPIILKPVGADWDCQRLMQARDELFPPTPQVDW